MIENARETVASPEVVEEALRQLKASLEGNVEAQKVLRTVETAVEGVVLQLSDDRLPNRGLAGLADAYVVKVTRPMTEVVWNRTARALLASVEEMSDDWLVHIASCPTDKGALIEALSEALLESADQLSARERAELRGAQAKKAWLEERGGSLSPQETADLMGVKRQTVSDKRNRGEILGVPVAKGYRYPAWQFGDGKPLKGLKEVLHELNQAGHSDWAKLRFFLGENDFLKANYPATPTPIDALKANKREAAAEASASYLTHVSL